MREKEKNVAHSNAGAWEYGYANHDVSTVSEQNRKVRVPKGDPNTDFEMNPKMGPKSSDFGISA